MYETSEYRADVYSPDWDAAWNCTEPVPLQTHAQCSNCTYRMKFSALCIETMTIKLDAERCPAWVEDAAYKADRERRENSWKPEPQAVSRMPQPTRMPYVRAVVMDLASHDDLSPGKLSRVAGISIGRARDWVRRMVNEGLICMVGKRRESDYPCGPMQKVWGLVV